MPKWMQGVYFLIGAFFAFLTVVAAGGSSNNIGNGVAAVGLAIISSTTLFLSSKKL